MASEAEFWGRSLEPCAARLDTSTLGPIRVDPNDLAIRARVVREALIAATENDPSSEVAHFGQWVANHASPVTLAKLGRMLK